MTPLSQKYIKDLGLWENKRCIPKEGMSHASACHKKEENKRYIPKEGMPHASACQKKKENKRYIPKEGMPHA